MNYKNWPISKQIGSLALLCSIVIFALMSFFSYKTASTTLNNKAINAISAQMQSNAELIKLQYDSMLALAESSADILRTLYPEKLYLDGSTVPIANITAPSLMHGTEQINTSNTKVDKYTELTGGVATIFVLNQDDFTRISTSLRKADGERATGTNLGIGHPGYQRLIKGEDYQGYAKLFGKDYMTIYRPLKSDTGQVIAILFTGFDITESVAQIQQAIKQQILEESGYYAIIRNSDNNIIVHKNINIDSAFDPSLFYGLPIEKILTNREPLFYTSSNGENMFAYSIPILGWNWTMTGLVPEAELHDESMGILKLNLLIAVIGIILISALLFSVIKSAISPLQRLKSKIATLGQGDLSQHFELSDPDSENEVDQITMSISKMATNLCILINSLQQSVVSLEHHAQNSQQVASVNGNEAKSLLQQTEHIATAIEEMSASIKNVAENSGQGALQAQEIDHASNDGHRQLTQVVIAMQSLSEQLTQTQKNIEGVNHESVAISKVTEVINSIAEQTNLLALNAAIEAARAGEQGRGFAVVADEVRSLAKRTQESISIISSTISNLQKQVEITTSQMKQCQELGLSSVEQGDAANSQLSQINANIAEMAMISSSIAAATKEQSTVADEVSISLHAISSLASDSDERATKAVKGSQ
ncbi:methyl-accepting chemotaxis protein [Shewanella phaeophyticola]|uniref:methyl-accepting chemotaxis protein n=1 Tax=Shewanella phaeophyticola TaxID=2978345 RepID=UPI0028F727C9|nr:methyl-accepting chemotaxis protein [Shewanella sp. KJ10-1]